MYYDGREVLYVNLIAKELYQASGTPWFSGFERPVLEHPEEAPVAESELEIPVETDSFIEYHSRIQWEEGSERAEIFFSAVDEVVGELETVGVEGVSFPG